VSKISGKMQFMGRRRRTFTLIKTADKNGTFTLHGFTTEGDSNKYGVTPDDAYKTAEARMVQFSRKISSEFCEFG